MKPILLRRARRSLARAMDRAQEAVASAGAACGTPQASAAACTPLADKELAH